MVKALVIVSVVLLAAFAVVLAYGAFRWRRETLRLRARLQDSRSDAPAHVVDFRELEGLPPTVQRYFRAVLVDGLPVVSSVRVRHGGTFDMGNATEQWKRFESDQLVIIRWPGFDWDARIRIAPGLTARVHDAYVGGEGILHASLFGLITLVNLRGTGEVAEGELMRYLAEAAWYPTALLPSQGVSWEPVDDGSARGTLVDGPISVTMLFTFDESGLIESVRAEARGRTVGTSVVPTPWQGRFWNYERRGGMLVPLDGEVMWLLREGPRPYWRGRIEAITYQFADAGGPGA